MQFDLADYHITNQSMADCIGTIVKWINNGSASKSFVCANPHSIETALRDPLFEKALKDADLVVPDGFGLVWGLRVLGENVQDRITGTDIFLGLSEVLNTRRGCSYFFLGSTEQVLKKIKDRIQADFPFITIAGTYSPPYANEFSEHENNLMIDAINAAQPDVLWVGMTAPKQEKWIHENRHKLNVKFIGAIGAVFDFYAGVKKRSHPWFQKHGIEWLPRVIREPGRLWRRTLISMPVFMCRVLIERIRQ